VVARRGSSGPDPVALVEIDLYGELMIAASSVDEERLSPDRIETMEQIQFSGTRISKASFNLLGQIAANLRAHTEITRLRITAHVNPSRSSDRDQAISDKRAEAVRDWLVQWGIDGKRLEARGFGGDKPMVPASQKGAASINDRLELIILERK